MSLDALGDALGGRVTYDGPRGVRVEVFVAEDAVGEWRHKYFRRQIDAGGNIWIWETSSYGTRRGEAHIELWFRRAP